MVKLIEEVATRTFCVARDFKWKCHLLFIIIIGFSLLRSLHWNYRWIFSHHFAFFSCVKTARNVSRFLGTRKLNAWNVLIVRMAFGVRNNYFGFRKFLAIAYDNSSSTGSFFMSILLGIVSQRNNENPRLLNYIHILKVEQFWYSLWFLRINQSVCSINGVDSFRWTIKWFNRIHRQ